MSVNGVIIAILIFSIIVIIHELGHFLLAKANDVEVTEFSLGMGPRLLTFIKTDRGAKLRFIQTTSQLEAVPEYAGHTWYSLKLLPIGGSCLMLGEEEEINNPRAFNRKSVYVRMSIIAAGPIFNFLLAFLLALIIVGSIGYDVPKVTEVVKNQAMDQAGFQKGDKITEIDGKSVVINRDISMYLQFNPLTGKPVKITVNRNGTEITKTVTPVLVPNKNGKKQYKLGFGFYAPREKVSALQTVKYAAYEVKFWITTTVDSLGQLIRGKVSKDEIAGPVGIVSIVDSTVKQSEPAGIAVVLQNIMIFCILLTANLGVMNLLPIPALDGGRLVFLIIEWIRRKPLNKKFEGVVNFAGFAALMLLMVFVMYNDIMKLI